MSDTLVRDGQTWALYAAQGLNGWALNGLGSILAPLQDELGVTRSQVAFYPTMFAAALLVMGTVGGRLVAGVGHRVAFAAALLATALGALALGAPVPWVTALGAGLIGAGSAMRLQISPAIFAMRFPRFAGIAFGEATALASLASILVPLAVAVSLASGAGWRIGYLVPMAVLALALLLVARLIPARARPATRNSQVTPALQPGRILPRWLVQMGSVSVEFCFVFWAADAFRVWHGIPDAAATGLLACYMVGMTAGRAFAALVIGERDQLLVGLTCVVVTLAGFGIFWFAPGVAVSAFGLAVAGLGSALLAPLSTARLLAADPARVDALSARSLWATGLAIGGAPFLLAWLSDHYDLHSAYLIVPAILALMGCYLAGAWWRLARR